MNVNEYLDDILKDVCNKKIDKVISKLDSKINIDFSGEEKKKILEISQYLINNDLTIYNDEPLSNIVSMLEDIKTNDSYFYAGSIYYDMALKNHSIEYFKRTIENLLKCEATEEINKIISDSYFYIFILSKEEETNIKDLKLAKKYLLLANINEDIELFKIEYNFCGYYLKNSLFKKAISHGLRALKYKNDPECEELLPELYCFIGLSYLKIEDFKKSIRSYKKAIDLIYLSKDIDLSLLKEALFNLSEDYNAIKSYHLELKTRIALKHILDEEDDEDAELIYVNSRELAYIEKYNNQLSYAIKDAKTALKYARKLNVSLDRLYESILLVAYVYYDLGNYELYIKYMKNSISTAKLVTPKNLSFELLTNSLNEIAAYYFISASDECIDYYLELKDLYFNNLDNLTRKNIYDAVEVCLSLAKILSNKNEFNDALFILEEIKSIIGKKTKDDKSFYYELSLIYNRLGIIYSDINEMQKTIDYFILAINTFDKTESKEHVDILDPFYSNLVNAYEETEEYELAIHTLNKKLELVDVIYNGKDIADYLDAKADVLFELAHEYKSIDDDQNSKKMLEDIIELLENYTDIKSVNIMDKLASAYDEYGNILTVSSDDDVLAISYFSKAKEIFKQLLKYNSKYAISVLYTNNSIAYCYQYIPDNEKAEKYYLESLELINKYEKKYDFYDEFTHAIVMRGLALLYDQIEDIAKAEYYYLEAIKLFEDLAKGKDDYYVQSLIHLYNNVIKFYDHIMNTALKNKYQAKLNKLNLKNGKK
ncbi:MAG: tetratricopeptide repeat protein [Acholeplasmatales bacterium]|nr:tetratricopeptide repeat protein [Acholeplasmatales bacterium]